DAQNELRKWNDFGPQATPGPLPLTGTATNAAVVGEGVARVLQLCGAAHVTRCTHPQASSRVELLAATAHGAPNVASLSIVKAESQAVKELDDVYVAMHLAQAQRLIYGRDTPQVTAIVVQLRHTAQLPAARARLEYLLGTALKNQSLEVHDYE